MPLICLHPSGRQSCSRPHALQPTEPSPLHLSAHLFNVPAAVSPTHALRRTTSP
jgi:hypothetical protein